jgi:translocation and assembly module TamB
LASQHVAGLIASRLQAAYGGMVQVASADISVLGESTLHDVQLFESGENSSASPWVVIEDVQADVSVWSLLGGEAMPRNVTLVGAVLSLRFDSAGRLVTRLPKLEGKGETLPTVRIEQGKLTLQQEGRPDLVIAGLRATGQTDGEELVLNGTAADPYWGDWDLRGTFHLRTGVSSVTLTTRRVHITQAMLDRLPFVPAKVWQQVQCEGDSPVELTVSYEPQNLKVHYRILLELEATKVDITSIDLHADQTHGKVVVEDEVVRLTDVQGRTADGVLQTSGLLDFRSPSYRLNFSVRAERLDLSKLPKSWHLPRQLNGRLAGDANLQVVIEDGTPHPHGKGKGSITGARIGRIRVKKPIELFMDADGEKFYFNSPPLPDPEDVVTLAAPLLTVGLLAPPPSEPSQPVTFFPAQVVNWLGTGIAHGVQALTRTGADLLARLPAPSSGPAKPGEKPTYLEANLALDEVDLKELVSGLGFKLPIPVSGRVSLQVQMALPLDAAGDLKAYRLRGTAASRKLDVAGVSLEQIRARVVYSEGVLRLEEFRGRMPAPPQPATAAPNFGTFEGTARLEVIPQGNATANLTLKQIPLQQALRLVPGAAERTQGNFSGTLQARVPVAQFRQMNGWQASGSVTAERIRAYGWDLTEATAKVRLNRGVLSIAGLRGQVEGMALDGFAGLQLDSPYRHTGHVQLRKGDLAALRRLAPELRPPLPVEGHFDVATDFQGSLHPFTWQASGTGSATDLKVEHLELGSVKFRWESDAERLKLLDLNARLYKGEIKGTATVPLRESVPGSMEIRFENLDIGALARAVPAVRVRLEGEANGTLQGTLTAAKPGREREFTSNLDVQASRLRVQGILTERLTGTVDYRKNTVSYRAEGETLGGRFRLNGQIPPAKAKPGAAPPADWPPEGRFRLERARLTRLWETLGLGSALRPLRGTFDIDLTFRHSGPNREPVGSGRLILDRLRWAGSELASTMTATVRLTEQELRLTDLSGILEQGLLRGTVAINLRHIGRSWFTLAVEQGEAARLLAPWPALAEQIQGSFDARLRGRIGSEWYGSAEFLLSRGRVFGIDVTQWRLPLTWAFAPGRGQGQVEVRDSTAYAAQGRLTGQASLTWGTGLRLDGHLRFFGLELRTLLHQMADLSQMGTGRFTGRLDFAGSDVRSVEDVTATLDGLMQQTQALQLPVLQQLLPFLPFGQSAAASFQRGDVRARLARGIVRIERMSFAGTWLQVFIEGTVTLQGRLNLEVTANTGQLGASPSFLRLLGLRLPVAGPIPVGLLLQASTYLSNRVVHLRVNGTIRSPIIRIEPVALLTDEVVRFFVNQANLPVP